MQRRIVALLALAVLGGAVITAGAAATARSPFPGDKLDFQSALPLAPDAIVAAEAPASSGGSTGSGTPPRIGDNVFANATQIGPPYGAIGRSETTISLHGQNLLAGWNDADGFCGTPFFSPSCPLISADPLGLSGYGYSTDGGKTWTDGGAPPLLGTDIITRGDPWLDNNGAGPFYYANLAVDTTGAGLGVSVHRGHFADGAFVWDDAQSFDAPVNATEPDFDFYDKEALVAGKGANRNDAYVTLTNFRGFRAGEPGCPSDLAQWGNGRIEAWRTHDGGATWQGPATVADDTADSVASCAFEGTIQQSSAPAVGPQGEVYVVWQIGPTFNATYPSGSPNATIAFAKSTDGGETFSAPATVAAINSSRNNPPIGYNRARVNDHPRIDVARTGKYQGRIYVTYYSSVDPVTATSPVTQRLVDIQVYVKYSDDGGQTWSDPKLVAGALPTHSSTLGAIKRWWPDVTVGPGGEVHVVYLEEQATQLTESPSDTECVRSTEAGNRTGVYSSLVDTWWTYSKDGGSSWSMPLKLSSGTSYWCTPFGNPISNIRPNMGDYIDAQAGPGLKVYALWADGRDAGEYPPFGPGEFLMAGSAFAAGKS